jgi:microcompartment protein CcmL/EutN
MSMIKDILSGLKTTIELNGKVTSVATAVDRLATDIRDLDRRLVRVETMIEIARPDGSVLRIARDTGKGGSTN